MTPEIGKPARGGLSGVQLSRAARPEGNIIPKDKQAGRYPETPGFKGEGAGREAAEAFKPKVAWRRQQVLDHIGDDPITADELAARIGRATYIVRPRISELFALGEVVKCPGRGVSDYGAAASLWRRATSEERAIAAAKRAIEAEKMGGDA